MNYRYKASCTLPPKPQKMKHSPRKNIGQNIQARHIDSRCLCRQSSARHGVDKAAGIYKFRERVHAWRSGCTCSRYHCRKGK
ncbi:unnamed protein product [Periconia digitata]|uniref:Uncharacterized protein n=1 Tax=Periconia digitata TaxID=1303443 RepID=A0A9W4UHZ9_9PLEO|nr:unnamed protein product [Periconia digitata]